MTKGLLNKKASEKFIIAIVILFVVSLILILIKGATGIDSITRGCVIVSGQGSLDNGLFVGCPSDYTVTGGGWKDSAGNDNDEDISRPLNNGWFCKDEDSSSDSRCYAVCCNTELIETTTISKQGFDILLYEQTNLRAANVECPNGYNILGGGFGNADNGRDMDILKPVDENKWLCGEDEPNEDEKCFGVCGKAGEGYALSCINVEEQGRQDLGGVFVSCPENYFVTGGGFSGEFANEDDQDNSFPIDNGWYCAEDNSINNAKCYARCCNFELISECADNDGDGFAVEGGECGEIDCDDNNPEIHPNAQEVCNNIDDNCNLAIDEGIEDIITDVYGYDDVGECRVQIESCVNGEFQIVQEAIGPEDEICNDLLDNDCDELIDCNDDDCEEDENCIEEIACYENSDCGQDGCIGMPNYCMFGNVYQDFIYFTCHNPGTIQSYCSNTTFPLLLDDCLSRGEICIDGFCEEMPEECQENEECGEESLIENYCIGDDVYSNYSIPSCLEGECQINYESRFNETCEFGCEDGECLPEIPECANNEDCGNASSQITCHNNDITNFTITPSCISGKCENVLSYELVEECEFGCSNGECEEEEEEREEKIIRLRGHVVNYCGDGVCDLELGEDEYTCYDDCVFGVSRDKVLSSDTGEEEKVKVDEKISAGINNSKILIFILLLIFSIILFVLIIYLLRK